MPQIQGANVISLQYYPIDRFLFWYERSIVLYTDHYWSYMYTFETGQEKFLRIGMHLLANVAYVGGARYSRSVYLCLRGCLIIRILDPYHWCIS